MFKALICARKGHLFVDSRSQPGVQVCVRCQRRQPFEGLHPTDGPTSGAGAIPPSTDPPLRRPSIWPRRRSLRSDQAALNHGRADEAGE